MVTNTELTIDQITEEALIILKNKLGMGNRCLRQYDGQFAVKGAKIGDNLRIRVPPRYISTTGPAPTGQNFTETYKDIAAQTQRNVLLEFTSKDLSLAIDEFSERVIEPAVVQLAQDIDSDGTSTASVGYTVTNSGYVTANYAGNYAGFMSLATPGPLNNIIGPAAWTGNSVGGSGLGTAGATSQANAAAVFFQAQSRLTEQGAPGNERYCVLSPGATATLIPNLFTLFNPAGVVGEMFEEGQISTGMFAGATFFESPSIQSFTSGSWSGLGNTSVAVSSANGDTTIALGNVGASAVINAGDQFVVNNVFTVNPLTRQSQLVLQVFTNLNTVTANAAGNVTCNVYPVIQPNGQFQTITAAPIAGAQTVFAGTRSTTTQVNLYYQKNAIALAVAPLAEDLPGAEVSRMTSEEDNLSLRYVRQYQALVDQVVSRLDILYGWAVTRPELGARVQA